jgi:hypothetical protein
MIAYCIEDGLLPVARGFFDSIDYQHDIVKLLIEILTVAIDVILTLVNVVLILMWHTVDIFVVVDVDLAKIKGHKWWLNTNFEQYAPRRDRHKQPSFQAGLALSCACLSRIIENADRIVAFTEMARAEGHVSDRHGDTDRCYSEVDIWVIQTILGESLP